MDNSDKHPWEDEAWVEMHKMLDDKLPTAITIFGLSRHTWSLLCFLILSFISWTFLDDPSVVNESDAAFFVEDSFNEEAYSYQLFVPNTFASSDVSKRGFHSQPFEYSSLYAAYRPKAEMFKNFSLIGGTLDDSDQDRLGVLYPRLPHAPQLPQNYSGNESILQFLSIYTVSSIIPRDETRKVRVRPFLDGHLQHQSGRYWGGGVFLGTSFSAGAKWQASLSTGYQYLRRERLFASDEFSVPLVLPGADPNMGSTEEGNRSSLGLPAIQVHGHRVAFQGQLNRKLAGKFSAGALARISVDWTSLSPDIRQNPLRYHYPDLRFNKGEFRSRHINIGVGLESAYAFSSQWKFYVRGLLSKQFASLTSNRNYLESHLWTLESGFYYRF